MSCLCPGDVSRVTGRHSSHPGREHNHCCPVQSYDDETVQVSVLTSVSSVTIVIIQTQIQGCLTHQAHADSGIIPYDNQTKAALADSRMRFSTCLSC